MNTSWLTRETLKGNLYGFVFCNLRFEKFEALSATI